MRSMEIQQFAMVNDQFADDFDLPTLNITFCSVVRFYENHQRVYSI